MKLLTKLRDRFSAVKASARDKAERHGLKGIKRASLGKQQKADSTTQVQQEKTASIPDQERQKVDANQENLSRPTVDIHNRNELPILQEIALVHETQIIESKQDITAEELPQEPDSRTEAEQLPLPPIGVLARADFVSTSSKNSNSERDASNDSISSLAHDGKTEDGSTTCSSSMSSIQDEEQVIQKLIADAKHELPVIIVTAADETAANDVFAVYPDRELVEPQAQFPAEHFEKGHAHTSVTTEQLGPRVAKEEHELKLNITPKPVTETPVILAEGGGGLPLAVSQVKVAMLVPETKIESKVAGYEKDETVQVDLSQAQALGDNATDSDEGDVDTDDESEDLDLQPQHMKTILHSLITYDEGDAHELLSKVRNAEDLEQLACEVRANNNGPDVPKEFRALYHAVDFDALQVAALKARRERLAKLQHSIPDDLTCEVSEQPRSGSYNLVLGIAFSDGTLWVAKIPGYGTAPTDLQKEKMESEYRTQQYVRSKTDFKMPEVFYWTTDPTEIGAAFGLMDFVHGTSLYDAWKDPSFSVEKCFTAVGDVAHEMAKLYALQFAQTGTLRFEGDHGMKVGAEIQLVEEDDCAWAATRSRGPFGSSRDYFKHAISVTQSPLSQGKEFWVDHTGHDSSTNLRLLLRSIPQFMHDCPLTLCLADPDYQNIYVDFEGGKLVGFIDLDNFRITPATVGSAAYPPIITRDCIEDKWLEELTEDGMSLDQSDLDIYPKFREHYASCFKAAIRDAHYDDRWTKLSHHMWCLDHLITVSDHYQPCVVRKIINDVYKVVHGDASREQLATADMMSYNPRHRLRLMQTIKQGLWKLPGSPAQVTDSDNHTITAEDVRAASIQSMADRTSKKVRTSRTWFNDQKQTLVSILGQATDEVLTCACKLVDKKVLHA